MRVSPCVGAGILAGALIGCALAGCGGRDAESAPDASITARPAAAANERAAAASATGAASPSTAPVGDRYGPAASDDQLHPVVELVTSRGTITLRLDAENAPATVHNFLNYVNAGHYDQTIFHYVQPGEMILGGGYTADLAEKPADQPIRNEAHNGLKNRRGTIAMARDPEVIDSARCQFFINLNDNHGFDFRAPTAEDYGYCVFGRVIDGLEVAEAIASVETHDRGPFVSTPVDPPRIESARQLR